MVKIIVMQTSIGGMGMSKRFLNEMGLVVCEDYIVCGFMPSDDWFSPGSRQMFITGSFEGSSCGVAEMVQRFRAINPELVVASFAIDPLPDEFDYSISKRSWDRVSADFKGAVQAFLDGTLNRKV